MDKNKATALIEETFDKAFDKQVFIRFIQNLLNDIDLLNNEYPVIEAFQEHVSQYTHLANYHAPEGETVDILTVEVSDEHKLDKARTSLRNFAVDHLNRIKHDYALVAYYSKIDRGCKWRFSFIKIEHLTTVVDGKIIQEKDFTPARRYSFAVGEKGHNRTAKERFLPMLVSEQNPSIKQLKDAFSVETLTQQFYNELFDWYLWALSDNNGFKVNFPNYIKLNEPLIRLITRMIFIWFLKQKKIEETPLAPEELFDTDKLSEILVDFDPQDKRSGNYYNAILQNLFFATLNRPINEREFAPRSSNTANDGNKHFSINAVFRDDNAGTYFKKSKEDILELFRQTPFLNGGLFECMDKYEKGNFKYYDGFSRDNRNKAGKQVRTFIPNHLFFAEKENVLIKNYISNKDKNIDVLGLLTILKRYNFTIEENTPFEVEVALDPELLGKVFENLLGTYNDETKEWARKESGSFYTPRTIVNYMVNESLKHYLLSYMCSGGIPTAPVILAKAGIPAADSPYNEQTYKETVELLFSDHPINPNELNKTIVQTIIRALNEVKILDPACGSGAFPMGILNRIIEVLKKMDANLNSYETKLNLIEKCIYGVDKQPIAVQISKLRFFISLICEQTPNNDPDDNYGIRPLPNLESKFVAADTLIALDREQKDRLNLDDETLQIMKNELWDIRNHKNLHVSSSQEKHMLREKDRQLCKKIEDYLLDNSVKPDAEKILSNKVLIKQFEKEVAELPEVWVDNTTIQASLFGDETKQTLFQIDRNKEKRNILLKRIQNCKAVIAKEERKATVTGLEKVIHDMVGWDPYDQNSTSPFFDPEWMFGLACRCGTEPQSPDKYGSFDIIIGNPPYLKEGRIWKTLFANYKDSPYYQGKMDLWYMFACCGIDFLNVNGCLCFIATNNWVTSGGARLLRNKVISDTQIKQIVDFGNFKIFETADIQTMVMLFSRNKVIDYYHFDYRKLAGNALFSDVLDLLNNKPNNKATYIFPEIIRNSFKDKYLTFSTDDTVLDKITPKGIFLTEDEVAQGIVPNPDVVNSRNIQKISQSKVDFFNITVGDGVFILNKNVTENFPNNEQKYIKTVYEPTDVEKYCILNSNKRILYITKNNYDNDAPRIVEHLDKYKEIMEDRRENLNRRLNFYHLHWPRDPIFFSAGSKILSVRKCDKPTFAYTEKEAYVMMAINIIKTNRFNLKYLVGLLNSKLIAFWLKNKGKLQGDNYQVDKEPLLQIPLYHPTDDQQQPIITIVDYLIFLTQTHNKTIIPIYFEKIIDACIYELYFPEEVHTAKKGVIEQLQDVTPIEDTMPDNQKLSIINSEFIRLYDPYHPVRNNVETIENIETIRIIKNSVS